MKADSKAVDATNKERPFGAGAHGDQGNDSGEVTLFSTCPPFAGSNPDDYLDRVVDAARWSESSGCTGILVYTDNGQLDPWLVAQLIMQHTERLCPLVAVQPVYAHPYAVAKAVTSLARLHGRRMYLNMVAGGFRNDLLALNDTTPHDRRYDRLLEYTAIVKDLLAGESPLTYHGEFYTVENLKLAPACPPELQPGIFISGSSPAGVAAAKAAGATAIHYPKPVEAYRQEPPDAAAEAGIRIGVISRAEHDQAWSVAHRRFPADRQGQLLHQLAMKVSDSAWHKQLSELGAREDANPYWLVPFENYQTMCPYLVGDYDEVGDQLAAYMKLGYRTFITDVPPDAEELGHVGQAFARARKHERWQRSSRIG